ncbi:hypothetical protein CC80DRAFT_438777 [Byssothecium circinans]|uniref:Prion-inhibition and propagation HeLo domain-containing protein n=1 Tax=Byssothecium circinans TaxID=147558 RepID=A0A6A5U5Q8_9PLEO|nr:hypothetical protein CC80DRAFT_438777 [Byssothecium circinans]
MEAGGLAVGLVALAGLFNNAVDCFEFVQLARNIGKDFQTDLLKLDNAGLRLSRWGKAAGLSGQVANAQSLRSTILSTEDIPKAEELLGQVLELFKDAERESGKFKSQAAAGDSSLLVVDTQADVDSDHRTLHEKMRELSIERKNNTPLQQKVKWALYKKKYFERLIADIIELVDDLIKTFPAVRQAQQDLCKEEVSEIGTNEILTNILDGIAASQDQDLHAVILEVLKKSDVGATNTWNNYNSKIMHQGGTSHVHGNQLIQF